MMTVDAMIEDLRRIVLGLLFVVAFGWMAALVFPGERTSVDGGWAELAATGSFVPPAG